MGNRISPFHPYLNGELAILHIKHGHHSSLKGSPWDDRGAAVLLHLHDNKVIGNKELSYLQWDILKNTDEVHDIYLRAAKR